MYQRKMVCWFTVFKSPKTANFYSNLEGVNIPVPPERRKLTDKKGFLIFGIIFVIFLPFFIYAFVNSDIRRLFHAYDNCGNLCGVKNEKIPDISCSGKDYTTKPYGTYGLFSSVSNETSETIGDKTCFATCPEYYKKEDNFCKKSELKENDTDDSGYISTLSKLNKMHSDYESPLNDSLEDDEKHNHLLKDLLMLPQSYMELLFSFVLTITLCFIVLLLLRFAPAVVVWSVFTLIIFLLVTITGISWSFYASSTTEDNKGTLALSIVCTIITLSMFLLLVFLYRRMRLKILLYKEATQAIFAMPCLLILPIIVIFLQLVTVAGFVTSTAWMISSAKLVKISEDSYDYIQNGLIMVSICFNFVLTFWVIQFLKALKYMMVSGSVVSWYFTKNKRILNSPITRSVFITIRYHIGTVVFGSFIITSVFVFKIIMNIIFKSKKIKKIINCCIGNLELFLKTLSNKAYVETAIHGHSFIESGRKATEFIIKNATKLIVLNSVGNFVMGMVKLILIIISTGMIGIACFNMTNSFILIVGCFIVNIVIITTIFTVLEAAIETLYICFCEDKEINDGILKPYYMSKRLMKYLENSEGVYEDKNVKQ